MMKSLSNSTKKNVIYGLIDPNTGELRYIGKTGNLPERIGDHHNPYRTKEGTHRANWIKSLREKGQRTEAIVLEEYDSYEELASAEIELIEYYRFIGCNLTNAREDSAGGRPGQTPWNKGTRGICRPNRGSIRPGDNRNQKLTAKQGAEILEKWTSGSARNQLARDYSIDRTCISRIIRGHSRDPKFDVRILTDAEKQDAYAKHLSGMGQRAIALAYGINHKTVAGIVKKLSVH
jgi:GIY-YIG catalytic domain